MDPTDPFTRPHSRTGMEDLRAVSTLRAPSSCRIAVPEEAAAAHDELDEMAVQAKIDALPPWQQQLTIRGLIVGAGECVCVERARANLSI
jgi:hypothetical protein